MPYGSLETRYINKLESLLKIINDLREDYKF